MSTPTVAIAGRRPPMVWAIWIAVSVVGAAIGDIVEWQLRALGNGGPASFEQDLAYVATLATAFIAGGAQWFFFRTFAIDADWWAPATAGANLINVVIIVPSVVRMFFPSPITTAPSMESSIGAAAAALAVGGLVMGAAQAMVLWRTKRDAALLWIPATVLGGALAGAVTIALSPQLLGMPVIASIGLVAVLRSLLAAGCQAPVIARLLR